MPFLPCRRRKTVNLNENEYHVTVAQPHSIHHRAFWLVKNACIHPVYLRKLVARLVDEGHDASVLLAPAKFTWESLLNRESMLSFEQGRLIIKACLLAAGRPTLGIDLGRTVQLSDHGALGWLMACSLNLREALQALHRFGPIRTGIWREILLVDKGGAWLIFEPTFDLGDVRAVFLDHFAGYLSRVISTVSQSPLDRLRLYVPWAPPPWRNAYHALAGTVLFNAERMAYWVPDSLLDKPNPSASRLDHRSAWEVCEIKLQRTRELSSLGAKLRYLMESSEVNWTDKEDIAARVGVSCSTLFRYLRNEGTSFRRLTEDVRQQRARWYLEYSSQTVGEIARTLGYSNESNFSRAFRRWSNLTPSEWRTLHQV